MHSASFFAFCCFSSLFFLSLSLLTSCSVCTCLRSYMLLLLQQLAEFTHVVVGWRWGHFKVRDEKRFLLYSSIVYFSGNFEVLKKVSQRSFWIYTNCSWALWSNWYRSMVGSVKNSTLWMLPIYSLLCWRLEFVLLLAATLSRHSAHSRFLFIFSKFWRRLSLSASFFHLIFSWNYVKSTVLCLHEE